MNSGQVAPHNLSCTPSRWYTHYFHLPADQKHATFNLAKAKMGAEQFEEFKTPNFAKLATLDCRVLLEYDHVEPNARSAQAELVKSYMHCVDFIPTHREYVSSGYATEPMLSEAAARILNSHHPFKNIKDYAPEILAQALRGGLLARGERGELIARTLLTVAHDLAILTKPQQYPLKKFQPHFHRPIRLVDLLENLLKKEVWDTVRNASPFHAYPDSVPLETAFEDAWVNFSCFARLWDYESFSLECAVFCLHRGEAMQTYLNRPNQHIGIPIVFGDPDTTQIAVENMSIAQFQIKNSAKHSCVDPDPTLIGKVAGTLPILSIVMQLGVNQDERVVVTTTPKGGDGSTTRSVDMSSPSDIQRRHYVITLYGCTDETYSCIPQSGASMFPRLLQAHDPHQWVDERPELMMYRRRRHICLNDLSHFYVTKQKEPEDPKKSKKSTKSKK
ncbi:MAG TPA: hypothetical protein VGO47_05450 [Chlamydiales bacterium]|nr:hypothetical protein [Chlamydiales bacterium]